MSTRIGSLVSGLLMLVATCGLQMVVRDIQSGETMFVDTPAEYLGTSIDPRIVRRLLGLRLLAADMIWVDCLVKSDTAHEKKGYTPLFRAFRAVTTLDPDNLTAYYFAGMYLSIIKDDVHAATLILKEGAARLETGDYYWPDSWRLPWILGYNLIFEEGNVEDGARWIRKAAESPTAPQVLKTLGAHVQTEKGRLEIAERVLNESYRHATRPDEKARIEAKMLEIGLKHELYDLNERFQAFLSATKATTFSKKRQFEVFKRSIGHGGKDMSGRQLTVNNLGRIVPVGAQEAESP